MPIYTILGQKEAGDLGIFTVPGNKFPVLFHIQGENYTLIARFVSDQGSRLLENWMDRAQEQAMQEAMNAQRAAAAMKSLPPADWDLAPAWANWRAVDAGGEAFWYSHEPYTRDIPFSTEWDAPEGYSASAGYVLIPRGLDWRMAVERRPCREDEDRGD